MRQPNGPNTLLPRPAELWGAIRRDRGSLSDRREAGGQDARGALLLVGCSQRQQQAAELDWIDADDGEASGYGSRLLRSSAAGNTALSNS